MTDDKKPFLYTAGIIALCIIASSAEPIAAKFAYKNFLMAPLALIAVKFASGGLLSVPSALFGKRITGRDFLSILPLAALLVMTTAFMLISLQDLSATAVITVITTTPAFVGFCGAAAGRTRLSKLFWPGFVLCFAGIFLTLDIASFSVSENGSALRGFVLAGLSVVMSTCYRLMLERLTEKYPSRVISAWMFIAALAVSIPCLFIFAKGSYTGGIIIGIALGAAAVIANVTFVRAIQLLGAARMSVISLIQRPVVIFLAAILLSEPLTWIQVTGIAMVIIGISIAKTEKIRQEERKEAES